MENGDKSCMVVAQKEFVLEAYGKNEAETYGAIFGKLKRVSYAQTPGLIIHMEPADVILIEEKKKTSTEKFLGFFAPREIQNYYVKVKIIADIKYIPIQANTKG